MLPYSGLHLQFLRRVVNPSDCVHIFKGMNQSLVIYMCTFPFDHTILKTGKQMHTCMHACTHTHIYVQTRESVGLPLKNIALPLFDLYFCLWCY